MSTLRTVSGGVAIVAALAALNVLVLKEDLFDGLVLVGFGVSAVAGLVWLVLRIAGATRGQAGSTLYGLNAVLAALLFLGICGTVYAFVKRWDVSWDLTQEGRRDLSPQTVQVLEGLKEDVAVTCFFVHGGDARVDLAQDKTRRFLERCQKHSDRLKTEFVDPQQHPERVEALNALRVKISVVGTIVLTSGARMREIPLSDVTSRLEEREFTNALLNVSRGSQPKVYFLTGHGERDIDNLDQKEGGSDFKLWLQKEAYEVGKHLVSVTNPSLPDDCEVLVINGMSADLHFHEIQVLDEYLARGGRLLVLLEPSMVMNAAMQVQEQFRPWLRERLGIVVGSDVIVSIAKRSLMSDFVPDFRALGDVGAFGDLQLDETTEQGFRGSYNSVHPITRGMVEKLTLSGLRSVTPAPGPMPKIERAVLLRTTPDTWAESDLQSLAPKAGEGEKRSLSLDPGELKGPVSVAMSAAMATESGVGEGSRSRDARVVVIGDWNIASNEGIDWGYNSNLLLNMMAWLTESEELIAIRATGNEDPPVILTDGEQQAVAWIASLGPVQAVALAGIVVLWMRRRYR